VDGAPVADVVTDIARPDVDAAVPVAGPTAGFETEVLVSPGLPHQVCAYGINRGPAVDNSLLGCKDVVLPVAGPVRGAVDTVSETAGTWVVYGWVWDPSGHPPFVVAEVDGMAVGSQTGGYSSRPDVVAAVPGAPLETGFRIFLDASQPGWRTVCVHGDDGFGNNTGDLGCLPIPPPTRAGSPIGSLDEVAVEVGRFVVRGWAVDPDPDPPEIYSLPRQVHVYVDGWFLVQLPLDRPRPDVEAVVPGASNIDGYERALPARPGRHQVCVYAINRGRTGRNTTLGCRDIDVPADRGAPLPFGSVDGTYLGPPGGGTGNAPVGVRGWAMAPGGAPVTVRIVAVGGYFGNGEQALDVTGTTGVARPDVPAVFPGAPPDTGYEILVGSGHFLQLRLACAVAQSADGSAEAVLGCTSVVDHSGHSF
jgi:hypothetical protein